MIDQIGRYRVIRLLGEGGMAQVFLAHDPEFNREVAIKLLPGQLADDPQFLGRFRREAQTIAALEHPAIVPVYDFGQQDTRPYLVMRYMPGGSLEDRLADGQTLTLDQAAALFNRLAPTLDEVHRRGIVHRDLKPGNILFDQHDLPYLSDFGIVKIGGGATATLTAHGSTIGTPAYMSPEQARGDSEIAGSSDIYALGVILFQVLSGDLPFKADTPLGLVVAHISQPVPDISKTRPDLPPATTTLISGAMAKDAAERPKTAKAMALTLSKIAAGLPTEAPLVAGEETIIEPLASDAQTQPFEREDSDPPLTAEPKKKRPAFLAPALGCFGFIVLMGIIAAYLFVVRGSLLPTNDVVSGIGAGTETATAEPLIPTQAPPPSATATEILPTNTPLPTPVPPIGSSSTYVEYILDASGSMLDELDGKPKLAIARDVLTSRLNLLPPDINVGLRVYGHRLPWQDDEEASCRDIELVVPLSPGAGEQISGLLPDLEAKGMTPMTESIRQASADFTFTPERNNLIVLLSDGIETCDEDPAEAVQFLQELGIDFTIHVIGLDVDEAAREQLQRLAAVAGGVYHDADSEDDLNDALGDVNEEIVQSALAQAQITPSPTPTATNTSEPPTATAVPSATPVPPTATFTPQPPTATSVPPTFTATPPPPTMTATNLPPTPTDVSPSPTSEPTATAELPTEITNITYEGTVGASSTYQGFPASLSVDGDRTTSWFSAGSIVDGRTSTYQWSIGQDELITSVTIISNANHYEPDFRTDFGFESMTMQIFDSAGNVVYENKAGLGGSPDPNVSFEPGVKGSAILLTFFGHESDDCGGFAELLVMAER